MPHGQGAGSNSPFERMMRNVVGFEHVESRSSHDAGSWYACRKRRFGSSSRLLSRSRNGVLCAILRAESEFRGTYVVESPSSEGQ